MSLATLTAYAIIIMPYEVEGDRARLPEASTLPGPRYCYTPLPHDPNSFRFARLLPGANNDEIQIQLENTGAGTRAQLHSTSMGGSVLALGSLR